MLKTADVLHIPQPGADPIPLHDGYGALSRYQAAERELEGLLRRNQSKVAPHLLAIVAENVDREMSAGAIAKAAQSFQVADDLVRSVPEVPIIYDAYREYVVGITPEDRTDGFKFIDVSTNGMHQNWRTVIPAQRSFSLRTFPERKEGEDQFDEGANMEMLEVLRFLVTPDQKSVDEFLRRDNGSNCIIVGQQAVNAFLNAQARKEMFDEDGEVKTYSFVTSRALVASGALKRLGGSSPIGKHGDFVHEAGVEALADVVAVAAGYEDGVSHEWRPAHDGNILRRLAGVDFDPTQDAQVVAGKATERAFSSRKGLAGRFNGLLYGDRPDVRSRLTEVAGNFMAHILDQRPE